MSHGYVQSDSKDALAKRYDADPKADRVPLTQISAVNAALDSVALKVLEDHVAHCVREGGDEKVAELVDAVARLVRSK